MSVIAIVAWLIVLVVALVAATLVGGLTARLFIRATTEEESSPRVDQQRKPTDDAAISGGERSPARR